MILEINSIIFLSLKKGIVLIQLLDRQMFIQVLKIQIHLHHLFPLLHQPLTLNQHHQPQFLFQLLFNLLTAAVLLTTHQPL
jgi:hypothetical protein